MNSKIKTDKNDAILSKYSSVNPEKIITKSEREFFVNMFQALHKEWI